MVGALVGIVVASPVMLLMCALIKLTSPGPVIYAQESGASQPDLSDVQIPLHGAAAGERREESVDGQK